MSGQTINQGTTQAVEKRTEQGGITQMVQKAQGDFAQVLPSHVKPETFTRLAVGCLRRDPELLRRAQQNSGSLMQALLEAARLGLEPGTDEYYLTPRGGKNPGVLGIIGYQGEIELIYRAGAVSSVKAELVRANDAFSYSPSDTTPRHEIDWFGDRGEVRGAYAYAIMRDGGTSRVAVVGPERIKRAMDASATAYKEHSPWKTDYGAMVLKTAIHDLQKWVPTSAEYRREQLRAVAEVAASQAAHVAVAHDTTPAPADAPAGVDPDTGEIVDGELVDDEPEEPAGEPDKATISEAQSKKLHATLRELGVGNRDDGLSIISDVLGRPVASTKALSRADASTVIDTLTQMVAQQKKQA